MRNEYNAPKHETESLPRVTERRTSPLKGLLRDSSHEEQEKIAEYIKELRNIRTPDQPETQLVIEKQDIVLDKPGDWEGELRRYMRAKAQNRVEGIFKEALKKKADFTRYIFVSDHQVPDHDERTIKATNAFVRDFAPDVYNIVGDFLNFTAVAKYDQDPYYHEGMADEIRTGKKLLTNMAEVARKANPQVTINWFEGNHERRLVKYLGRNASALAEITDDEGEYINSIPHIFNLREMGINWIPEGRKHMEDGEVFVTCFGALYSFLIYLPLLNFFLFLPGIPGYWSR